MKKYENLPNAPIVEAIIDFRVKLPQNFQVKKFTSLREKLKDRYPNVKERRFIEFEIRNDKSTSNPSQERLQGYFFESEDKKNVAQFRIDGFTFSRLKPYTKWEDIFAEAKDLWNLYRLEASPKEVTRIAVRYINHIEIPMSKNIDLSDYLKSSPNIPKNIPQNIYSFFSRIVINYGEKILANLTQALERRVNQNLPVLILDIDVFKKEEVKLESNEIWPLFEKLRGIKNDIFFSSITEKTKELFK